MRRATFRFCVLLAALAVLGRLIAYDYPVLFRLQAVPNHDMYQGAAFFTTNMHSVATTGEIAWWNPIARNGYAQYYQSFLSPLAPTPSHIAFIVWAQAIRALSIVGVRIPEYFQYLIVTYVVLPFLAFLAFAVLASLLFRRRASVALIVTVYCFSSIGLWNSAWFYFQEPASLFFLLAAAIAALRKPTWPRLWMLLLAMLTQAVSANYWTLYNGFFIVIFIGSFALVYRKPLRRLLRRAVAGSGAANASARPARRIARLTLGGLFVVTAALWAAIIGSIIVEQAGAYVRPIAGGVYTIDTIYSLVQPLRFLVLEPFDPEFERVIQQYPIDNPMHNARYIGAALLPFLALLLCYRWRRRELWLMTLGLGTLSVCLTPPLLVAVWAVVPFMNRIEHLFRFYSQYWQLSLALVATVAFEQVIGDTDRAVAARALKVVSALVVAAAVVLALALAFSGRFANRDLNLQAVVRVSLMVVIPSALMVQRFLFDGLPARRLLMAAVLLLTFADLSKYFLAVSLKDKEFTATRWVAFPLASNIQDKMRSVWATPDLKTGFASNIAGNLPVPNTFWPVNNFMPSRWLADLGDPALNAVRDRGLTGPPLEFFSPPDAGQVQTFSAPQPIRSVWREWTYNEFAFDVDAPFTGFLLVRQLADPLWRIRVDGEDVKAVQADVTAFAIPVPSGHHDVRMSYWPLARRLYWPASIALEATWLAVMVIVLGRRPQRAAAV